MSETLKEALSAAMDGEADEFELRRVIDEIGRDDELHATWERYHLARAALQDAEGHFEPAQYERLKAGVWEALDFDGEADLDADEAPAAGAGTRSWSPWIGRAVGLGVALGVALLIVVGAQDAGEANPAKVAELDVPVVETVDTEITESDVTRNNAYLMHHVQHTALNSAGVLSFVKVVTYEADDSNE